MLLGNLGSPLSYNTAISQPTVFEETNSFLRQIDQENELLEEELSQLLGQRTLTQSTSVQRMQKSDPQKNQFFYYEARLKAANSTIERLEKLLLEKDQEIRELQTQKPESTAMLRKKERETEKKVAELEKKAAEDQKTMQRLQRLNKELMAKVKENTEKEGFLRSQSVSFVDTRQVEFTRENQMMQRTISDLKSKLEFQELQYQQLSQQYHQLLHSAQEFAGKSFELYKTNEVMQTLVTDLAHSYS